MADPTIIFNPDVYLNHLAPDKASQTETARDLYLAILGVRIQSKSITLLTKNSYQIAVWDVLVYIADDIQIVRKGFGAVTFCFIFSR